MKAAQIINREVAMGRMPRTDALELRREQSAFNKGPRLEYDFAQAMNYFLLICEHIRQHPSLLLTALIHPAGFMSD